MRKSFFKKLSLGMALALVLGTTAHAGVAQAAEATWTLKKKSATVYLNEDNVKGTPDNYDFNFKNKPDNWKKDYSFNWYSENEEVATVAKGGVVTGVSVGKATIVCEIVNKKTYEVETVKATVTVKANAAAVEISNADKYDAELGKTVNVGDVIDLNRTMYDENGNKTTKRGVYVTDYTRWYVLDEKGQKVDETVATVNQTNGQFVINKAGIYGLVCETYQSSANPQAIVNDFVMVVVEEPFVVKQTTEEQFKITLKDEDAAKAMNDVDSFFIAKSDDHDNNLFVKSVSCNGNVVTVTMFEDFIDGQEYTVKYGKWDFAGLTGKFEETTGYIGTFVASVGRPVKVEMVVKGADEAKKDLVYVYHPYNFTEGNKLELRFFDSKGIDVTNLYFENPSTYGYVDFENTNNDVDFVFSNNLEQTLINELEVTAYKAGRYSITIEYTPVNEKTGDLGDTVKFPVTLRAVERGNATLSAIDSAWGLTTDNILAKKYSELKGVSTQWIAANDPGAYLVVTAEDSHSNLVSTAGVHATTDSTARDLTYDITGFTFKSENNRIASVNERSGFLTPNAPGKVKIAIYYADPYNQEATPKLVTYCVVEVKEAREIKTLTFDVYSTSLVSNVVNVKDANGEYITTNVTNGSQTEYTFVPHLKDQYGKEYSTQNLVFENALFSNETWNNDGSWKGYTFYIENVVDVMKATDKKSVEFTTKVWVDGEYDNNALCKTLRVTVRKPANDIVKSYEVEVSGAGNKAYSATTATLGIKVYGINYEGYRVKDITLAGEVAYAVGGLTADEYAKTVGAALGAEAEGMLFYVITKDGKVINPVIDETNTVVRGVVTATGSAVSASALTMDLENHQLGVVGYTYLSDRKAENCNTTTHDDIKVNEVSDGSYTVTLYQIKKSAATGKYGAIRLSGKAQTTAVVTDKVTDITVRQEKAAIEAGVSGVTRTLGWYTDDTLVNAVMDCFKIYIGTGNGEKFNETQTATTPIAIEARLNDDVLYVRNVKIFTEIADGIYAEHTVYVGKYIRVNQYQY